MTPRIKRDYSIKLKRMTWFCRGQGRLGFADSPKNAYIDWAWRMHEDGQEHFLKALQT